MFQGHCRCSWKDSIAFKKIPRCFFDVSGGFLGTSGVSEAFQVIQRNYMGLQGVSGDSRRAPEGFRESKKMQGYFRAFLGVSLAFQGARIRPWSSMNTSETPFEP